jgi:predicted metal-dependent HD superfamily phosphohydrolase
MPARQQPSPLAEAGLAEALDAIGVTAPRAAAIAADLARRYREPWRHYHTLAHVDAMFSLADRHRGLVADPDAVALAIWYHDAIYRPRRADNEAASAALLLHDCGASNLPDRRPERPRLPARPSVETAHRLILATHHHLAPPNTPDGAIFLDLDLAILGSPPDQYRRYSEAIRAEFRWVPEVIYRAKRIEALEGFLRRKAIFLTNPFLDREEPARQNLADEIAALR